MNDSDLSISCGCGCLLAVIAMTAIGVFVVLFRLIGALL